MQMRFFPAITMLLAGAVTCIISIIMKFDVLYSLKTLLIVLISFFIIGLIAQKIIMAVMKSSRKVNNNEEEIEDLKEKEIEEDSVIQNDDKTEEA